MNNNKAVRESAKEKRVKLWQVAERFGKSDSAFTRQMRHELSPEEIEGNVDNAYLYVAMARKNKEGLWDVVPEDLRDEMFPERKK